jgi:hypothetical protein
MTKVLDTEVWCTVHSGGLKFFGQLDFSILRIRGIDLDVGNRTAKELVGCLLTSLKEGNRTFSFNPCFEYQIQEFPVDEFNKVIDTRSAQTRPDMIKGVARNPKFTPFDFSTGPLILIVDSMQIGNLCDESVQESYEQMIQLARKQFKIAGANNAGLTLATSMADVKSVLGKR